MLYASSAADSVVSVIVLFDERDDIDHQQHAAAEHQHNSAQSSRHESAVPEYSAAPSSSSAASANTTTATASSTSDDANIDEDIDGANFRLTSTVAHHHFGLHAQSTESQHVGAASSHCQSIAEGNSTTRASLQSTDQEFTKTRLGHEFVVANVAQVAAAARHQPESVIAAKLTDAARLEARRH